MKFALTSKFTCIFACVFDVFVTNTQSKSSKNVSNFALVSKFDDILLVFCLCFVPVFNCFWPFFTQFSRVFHQFYLNFPRKYKQKTAKICSWEQISRVFCYFYLNFPRKYKQKTAKICSWEQILRVFCSFLMFLGHENSRGVNFPSFLSFPCVSYSNFPWKFSRLKFSRVFFT